MNIEKYIDALDNLLGVDNAYFRGDPDVDALAELIVIANSQQAEIERLSRLVVKEKDKKRIISEIFTRIKKHSFEDTRMKEGGGFEKVSMVFRDDVNKCLRDFLKEWIGDTE